MLSGDLWGVLLALVAVVTPLGLVWLVLAWGQRKRPGTDPEKRRP